MCKDILFVWCKGFLFALCEDFFFGVYDDILFAVWGFILFAVCQIYFVFRMGLNIFCLQCILFCEMSNSLQYVAELMEKGVSLMGYCK